MSKSDRIVEGFSTTLTLDEVKVQLNSREQAENLRGMRNLVGLMSHGVEVDSALPDVIKLVIHPDLAMRRCVYQFLAHFSESNPAQALMAVNILQRALADKNSLVRGMALRALSSIRVREIAEVARLSLEQHISDSSPFVRRIAALGIAKLHSFCPEFKDDLRDLLTKSLDDNVPLVFGAALQTFQLAFADEPALLHSHFHRICSLIPEMDSYEQVNAIQILHHYCRSFFADARYAKDEDIPGDLQVAFKAAGMLLRTNSNAVVIEAASFLYHVSPGFERLYEIAQVARSIGHAVAVSLIRILSSQFTLTQAPILSVISFICQKHPQFFAPHFREFFLRFKETTQEKIMKVQILFQIAPLLNDTDQDLLLNELKTYISYSLSQVYVEQQEITVYVIRVISKIVESKAFTLLQQQGQLEEFIQQYYSLLENPILRVYNNKYNEIAFANDVVFQQSVVELCRCLKQMNEIDNMTYSQVSEQVNDVLINQQQIYIDPVADEKQDSRYPIPKKLWPSYLGFDAKYDPLQLQNESHSGALNRKSALQCTRIKIFIQDQLRHLMSIYQISTQLSQSFMCLRMRTAIINTVKQLRFVCCSYVPEFLRFLVVRLSDEPFEVKNQILQLFQEAVADIELFRTGAVYLKQRRILSDIKQVSTLPEDDPAIALIRSRYPNEITQLSPEQIAEELGNIDYSIRQMAEYVQITLSNDSSYVMRDLAFLQQFSKKGDQIFTLNADLAEPEVILGTVSQFLCFKTEFFNGLTPFAAKDSPDSLRYIETKPVVVVSDSAVSQQQINPQPNSSISQQKQQTPIVETGITVRGKVNVDDFLNDTTTNKTKKTASDDEDYYYSDEEEQKQQTVSKAPVTQVGKPKIQPIAKPAVVQVAKPAIQAAKPTISAIKPAEKPHAAAAAPPAKTAAPVVTKTTQQPSAAKESTQPAKKEDDLMSLFSTDPKKEEKTAALAEQANKSKPNDLLSMLFQ